MVPHFDSCTQVVDSKKRITYDLGEAPRPHQIYPENTISNGNCPFDSNLVEYATQTSNSNSCAVSCHNRKNSMPLEPSQVNHFDNKENSIHIKPRCIKGRKPYRVRYRNLLKLVDKDIGLQTSQHSIKATNLIQTRLLDKDRCSVPMKVKVLADITSRTNNRDASPKANPPKSNIKLATTHQLQQADFVPKTAYEILRKNRSRYENRRYSNALPLDNVKSQIKTIPQRIY